MATRFLALFGFGEAGLRRCAGLAGAAGRSHGLLERFSAPNLTVLATRETPFRPIGPQEGVVLGELFERDAGFPDAPPRLSNGALKQGGAEFLRRYWGRYVGFAADGEPGDWLVLRDPSGGTPVYHLRAAGVIAFVSDVALARSLALARLEPSWEFVERHLAYPDLRLAQTGVSAIAELPPGEAAEVSVTGVRARAAWTPRGFAPTRRRGFAEACEEVGAVVRQSVIALARGRRSVALQLSGGLDSSIVAACLAQSPADLTFINLMAPGCEGDERRYAQAVADRHGRPLHVIQPEPRAIAATPHAVGLHPGPPSLFAGIDHALAGTEALAGVEAMITGGGGDNVFAHLLSAAPAADRLLAEGPTPGTWRTLGEIADIKATTSWKIGREAVRHLILRRPAWPVRRRFTPADWSPEPAGMHPWLEGGSRDPPARRARIAAVVGVQPLLDPALRPSPVPLLHPLLAQPVMETCLAMPSWLWVEGGVDRAVARGAFREDLPDLVVQRRGKGSLHGYFTRVFEASRGVLRELLADGVLARRGLVDGAAVRAYLDQPRRPRDLDFYRLFELADVELWLRGWGVA